MLVVVREPPIKVDIINGAEALLKVLEAKYGKEQLIVFGEGDDEYIEITETDWYKETELTPGDLVAANRIKFGITQKGLGEKIGKSPRWISDVENGRRNISKGMAEKLAEVFKRDYRYFL